jgi:hypothetical protein
MNYERNGNAAGVSIFVTSAIPWRLDICGAGKPEIYWLK